MAKRVIEQLNEAILNNVQDIVASDKIADILLDIMVGLSGADERGYLCFEENTS